jgi:hypothetical protein
MKTTSLECVFEKILNVDSNIIAEFLAKFRLPLEKDTTRRVTDGVNHLRRDEPFQVLLCKRHFLRVLLERSCSQTPFKEVFKYRL